jgi:hypothetical protein
MFLLKDADRSLKILGCADGPAGFNADATRAGYSVVSCDPLYQFTAYEIRKRIDAAYDDIMQQAVRNRGQFVWNHIRSVEELGRVRRQAMDAFLADYDCGRKEGRYVSAELPSLPFRAASFDLAVCSHFLFLYTHLLPLEFHYRAIQSLATVAREVRIFPLLTYNAEPSPFVEPVIARLTESRLQVSIEPVLYEFQRADYKGIAGRPGVVYSCPTPDSTM